MGGKAHFHVYSLMIKNLNHLGRRQKVQLNISILSAYPTNIKDYSQYLRATKMCFSSKVNLKNTVKFSTVENFQWAVYEN